MEEIYKAIRLIIATSKRAREEKNFVKLIINAEELLEYIPSLINYSVDQEHAYRVIESELTEKFDGNNKRNTSTYCETKAKATESYQEWRRADKFIDFMYEMINVSKKLAGTVLKDENN